MPFFLGLLKFIPGLGWAGKLIETFVGKAFDAKVSLVQARIGGDRDVAIKLVSAQVAQEHENTEKLGIFASNKFLTFLLISAAVPLVSFEWKVYVWDTMLGLGSTPAVHGQVAEWGNTVWYFLFGSPTALAVGKMWFNRNKTGE